MTSPHPLEPGEAATVHEALLEKQTVSCVLGFCQFPALTCLCPGHQHTQSRRSPVFYCTSGWDSKLFGLKGLVGMHPLLVLMEWLGGIPSTVLSPKSRHRLHV